MTGQEMHWEIFQSVVQNGSPDVIDDYLLDPFILSYPDNATDLAQIYKKIYNALTTVHRPLFELNLLTFFFRNKAVVSQDIIDWCHQNIAVDRLIPGLSLNRAASAEWLLTPVVLVDDTFNNNKILYFLVTSFQGQICDNQYPGWFKALFDISALGAINDAIALSRSTAPANQHPYLYMLNWTGVTPRITDRSLTLPLALGCRSALTGEPLYKRLIATGDLCRKKESDRICVGAVSGVPEKLNLVKFKKKYNLFIYPQPNHPINDEALTALLMPVEDFEEAWMWAGLYTPARQEELKIFNLAIRTAEGFANNCRNIPAYCLKWLNQSERIKPILAQVIDHPRLFEAMVKSFSDSVLYPPKDFEFAAALSELFDDEKLIADMFRSDIVSALNWCDGNMALACHCGDGRTERRWYHIALDHETDIRTQQDAEMMQYIEARFIISDQHNRYHFDPTLPEIYTKLLERQEDIYKKYRDDFKIEKDRFLGTLYGRISQNYAFSGPGYIDDTIWFSQKAMSLFETEQDCLQQYSYLFFAHLSVGRTHVSQALDCFLKSIKKESFDDISNPVELNPFAQYALIRLIAEMEEFLPDKFVHKMVPHFYGQLDDMNIHTLTAKPQQINPWQLWCYNLGILANNHNRLDISNKAWNLGIDLCLAGGETMQAMALLCLSGLWRTGMLDRNNQAVAEQIIHLVTQSQDLDINHFSDFDKADTSEAVFEQVYSNPGKYFPFNYR